MIKEQIDLLAIEVKKWIKELEDNVPTKKDIEIMKEEETQHKKEEFKKQTVFTGRFDLLSADLKVANFKINEIRKRKEDDPHYPHYNNFQK